MITPDPFLPDTASNFGSCVDIFAPGKHILTPERLEEDWVDFRDGTSIATPHVAGAAALYLQLHPLDSPQQVATAIRDAAYPYIVQQAGAYTTQRLLNLSFLYPNPTPLTVSILGKSTIRTNELCTWRANVQGGTGPFEYRWFFAGQVFFLSLVDSMSTVLPNSGQLGVVVTSFGRTQSGGGNKYITVTPNGSVCSF